MKYLLITTLILFCCLNVEVPEPVQCVHDHKNHDHKTHEHEKCPGPRVSSHDTSKCPKCTAILEGMRKENEKKKKATECKLMYHSSHDILNCPQCKAALKQTKKIRGHDGNFHMPMKCGNCKGLFNNLWPDGTPRLQPSNAATIRCPKCIKLEKECPGLLGSSSHDVSNCPKCKKLLVLPKLVPPAKEPTSNSSEETEFTRPIKDMKKCGKCGVTFHKVWPEGSTRPRYSNADAIRCLKCEKLKQKK